VATNAFFYAGPKGERLAGTCWLTLDRGQMDAAIIGVMRLAGPVLEGHEHAEHGAAE
jgi:hypothetical protein